MSNHREIFRNGNFYHIFNKTIDHKLPFSNPGLCALFSEITRYYRASDLRTSYSFWRRLDEDRKESINRFISEKSNFKVSIQTFCYMPNHFHFVLRQNNDDGIKLFMSNLMNSFTRFYNILNERKGPLFLPRFHSVPIVTIEQLLNVTRYVHLNPLAAGIVTTIEELKKYPWSSYKDYVKVINSDTESLVEINMLLAFFQNDRSKYQQFVENDLDHLQTLEYIREAGYTTSEVVKPVRTGKTTSEVVLGD